MMRRLVHKGLGGLLETKSTLFKDLDDLCFGLERYQDVVREVGCDEEDRATICQLSQEMKGKAGLPTCPPWLAEWSVPELADRRLTLLHQLGRRHNLRC